MVGKKTVAVVGACGGAGATRLTVEAAATAARAGHEVCVVDAALATQGLAGYVAGRFDSDLTRVLAADAPVEDALVDLDFDSDVPGRVAVCPASAPLERLARAQTAGSARDLATLLDRPGNFDAVLVDTPPVATNLALSAVTTADRVGVVTFADERGADALQRVRERLADAGVALDAVIANRTGDGDGTVEGDDGPIDADVLVPESPVRAPSEAPACIPPDATFAPAVARATESLLDRPLELEFPDEGLLDGLLE